jgi:uncharacterized membrane protein YqjE
MIRGIMFTNLMPLLLFARVLPFIFISTLVILTVIFWVIYGVKKYRWAKITAIILSSVLGLLFLCGITMTMVRGFMPFGNSIHKGMFDNFSGLKHGIRRF